MIRLWIISLFLSINGFLGVVVTPSQYPSDIDYSSSLVDWAGNNIEIDLFFEVASIETDYTRVALYLDNSLVWTVSTWTLDTEEGKYRADWTEAQKTQVLETIFNRADNNQENDSFLRVYSEIDGGNYYPPDPIYPVMYFQFSFKGLLNTSLESIYIQDQFYVLSTSTNSDPVFNNAGKYISLWDKNGQRIRIDNQLELILWEDEDFTDTLPQQNVYSLDQRLTSIKIIRYSVFFEGDIITSFLGSDTLKWTYNLSQLGFFASESVFIPDFNIDPEYHFFTPETAEWWQIGAHLRNFVNGTIEQVALFGEDLSSDLAPVIDIVRKPMEAFPDSGVRAVFAVLIAGLSIMLIYKIWRRIS